MGESPFVQRISVPPHIIHGYFLCNICVNGASGVVPASKQPMRIPSKIGTYCAGDFSLRTDQFPGDDYHYPCLPSILLSAQDLGKWIGCLIKSFSFPLDFTGCFSDQIHIYPSAYSSIIAALNGPHNPMSRRAWTKIVLQQCGIRVGLSHFGSSLVF